MAQILLTNDDGVHAIGLRVAREILSEFGDVVTIAPDREMSGASHSLTLNHPLRIQQLDDSTYAVNGTPTDCVSLAFHQVLDTLPQLVFSGINPGSNIGLDISYSGTVAAATEGSVHGVQSVAMSIASPAGLDSPAVAEVVREIISTIMANPDLPRLLNVNLPAGKIHGIRSTIQGDGGFRSEVIEKVDPRGNKYFWIGGQHAHDRDKRPETDIVAVSSGFVSVTPLALDLTDHGSMSRLDPLWTRAAAGDSAP